MGPLFPEIIGTELNLYIAFIIGIAFGFVLENAGFSSSRKLAGLFYGYDFVVLKVFFTAGITAMSGIVVLGYFGLINPEYLYINPAYLPSAIVGGAIMGTGFIIGGFCPGTSICAASVGKIDALAFIGGLFIGVMIFAESYPLVKGLYLAGYQGAPLIFESLGFSKGLFGFLLITVALAAFIFTTIIEKRVNGIRVSLNPSRNTKMTFVTAIAFIIGLTIIFMQDSKSKALAEATGDDVHEEIAELPVITIDELAVRLMERDRTIQVIDVRSPEEYTEGNIPTSFNIPFDSLANDEWRGVLRQEEKSNIFYSDNTKLSGRAAILSKLLKDNEDVFLLDGGWSGFKSNILDADVSELNGVAESVQRFHLRAKDEMEKLAEEATAVPQPAKKRKAAKGGC
jgi:rhodanese-related sulfurtransferase